MNKTAIFLSAIICIILISCAYTKSTNLKIKKSLKSHSNPIKVPIILNNNSHNSNYNYTNLYPIVDSSYEEALEQAENSGEKNNKLNKFYFCKNLTLAKEIHAALKNNISEFHGVLDDHRVNLTKFRKSKIFKINNKKSNYVLNSTNYDYDEFLGNLSRKYQNNYLKKIIAIEEIFEKGDGIMKGLDKKCEAYQNQPEEKKEELPNNNNTAEAFDESDKGYETFDFLELKALETNMSMKEKEVFNILVQMHERVHKIIEKFNV